MGMFDSVQCNYPLPDGLDAIGVDFQTKSMDSVLDTYIITEQGSLYVYNWSVDRNTNEPTFVQFNGIMVFRTYLNNKKHEYSVNFVDGKLVQINIVV